MRVVTYCLTSFSQPRRVTDGITCRKTANISKNFVYSIFQNLLSLIFINGSNFGFKFALTKHFFYSVRYFLLAVSCICSC